MRQFSYKVVYPKRIAGNAAPMLVMLHGYGSDENDLLSFAESLNERFLIVSLRAPIPIQWGGYAWYDINFMASDGARFGDANQALVAVHDVAEFIKQLVVKYNTDPNNTVLMGFSQGAITSYAVSLHYPNLIRSVVAMSGYIFSDIMPKEHLQNETKHLEYFVSHGTQDEVIPIAWARQADAWLTAHGLKHDYTEYTMGHGINPNCFTDMLKWLEARYPVL